MKSPKRPKPKPKPKQKSPARKPTASASACVSACVSAPVPKEAVPPTTLRRSRRDLRATNAKMRAEMLAQKELDDAVSTDSDSDFEIGTRKKNRNKTVLGLLLPDGTRLVEIFALDGSSSSSSNSSGSEDGGSSSDWNDCVDSDND